MIVVKPRAVTYGLDASIARFTVGRYQKMIDSGAITSEDKVELLENYVVLKIPRNPPHDGTIDLIKAAFASLPTGWLLRVQQAVALADSQPEPDFAIVRGTPRSYLARHPLATDVALLIEVANSSLLRDQRDKTRIYARAGVPAYWIVNLVDRRIEAHSQPSGPTDDPEYRTVRNFVADETIPVVLDQVEVARVMVADLLP